MKDNKNWIWYYWDFENFRQDQEEYEKWKQENETY